MGHIIYEFGSSKLKPMIHIERHVDEIETQKLQFRHEKDSYIGTEGGNSISLFGRDINGNIIEVDIPISPEELKEALIKYLKSK
jgi:hypothetical protein